MLGRRPLIGQFPAVRLFLVVVMVVAFVVQGYLTQTHIHRQNLSGSSIAQKLNDGSPKHDNYPADDDPANCPLCQQVLHSGQFVAPGSLVFFLPMLAISVIEIAVLALPLFDSVSHSWLGRGPPAN
jgi:hypothetical protein